MHLPGLGTLSKDDDLNWHFSEPLQVAVLGGHECCIVLEAYDDDTAPEDFHRAVANFLAIGPDVLHAAQAHVFQYYLDCQAQRQPQDREFPEITAPGDVWQHIGFGGEPMFSRRPWGDEGIYLSLECSCAWEREHGLQIVFRNGLEVNKVGPYDGHLSNSDACDDEGLEQVIYRGLGGA